MLQLPISTRLSPSKPQKNTLALWETSTDVCEILRPPKYEKQGIFRVRGKKDLPQKGRSFANVYTMGSVGSSFLALLNTTWLGSILALRSTNPFMPEAVHRWDTSDCI